MSYFESQEKRNERLKKRYLNDPIFNRFANQILHLLKNETLRIEDIEDALSMAVIKHGDYIHKKNKQLKEEFEGA